MNRRKFIRNLSYGGAGTMMLGGIPIKAMSQKGLLDLAAMAESTDNVLVFIQLHGGNDTLNTLIPISQYSNYYNIRSNIAIDEPGSDLSNPRPNSYINLDDTIDDDKKVGLHPEMIGIKEMYDNGLVAVVQNVGYQGMNLSHFEGRDLVFMGADGVDENAHSSGWMGRFLNATYPNYPDAYPSTTHPDPLGIELSGTQSLAYHREEGIPIGLYFNSPNGFHSLINSVGLENDPKIVEMNSHAGYELDYIKEFEIKSNDYADSIKKAYDAGNNLETYPDLYPKSCPPEYKNNPLSPQFKTIARLLSGGIKTRIFLCRMGGFDTHADQVERDLPHLGQHAALLHHLSESVKAFYDDLGKLGVRDKVMSMTFTEFGRRAYSNDSLGTDHGTSTPVFLFGDGVVPGVYKKNADLSPENLAKHGGNLQVDTDYRNIYVDVVKNWFGASQSALDDVGWNNEFLGLGIVTGVKDIPIGKNGGPIKIFPNPVQADCKVEFILKGNNQYALVVFNLEGKRIYEAKGNGQYGINHETLNAEDFKTGKYIVQVRSGGDVFTTSLIKQ